MHEVVSLEEAESLDANNDNLEIANERNKKISNEQM